MRVDIAAQVTAVWQAAALGAAAGVLYDLFRILRVRIRLPLLGPVLDFLFWVVLTGVLFLWSQWAWGGPVRLYGVAFLFFGGVAYFRLLSPGLLWLGYRVADGVAFCTGILLLPLRLWLWAMKKIQKLAKNIFRFRSKWYKINQITPQQPTDS